MPSEKTLKRIVIILGVLLVAGFAVVVTTIIYRAANLATGNESTPESAATISLNIPDGAKIIGGSKSGDLLTLHFETPAGDEKVVVLDMKTGGVVSELDIGHENQ